MKIAAMLAAVMQVLDMTIANVALPHMQAALGANQESVSWVLTSYIVASAIALPATGWLSNHLGRRTLFSLAIFVFMVSSVLCGIATTIEEMVIFRILQGVSGAFLSPMAQTVMFDFTPEKQRGQAMAMFGMGVMIGPILGPILGGFLTEYLDWRWVFFVNVPIGIVALAGVAVILPELRERSRPFDITGFILLGISLAALQLMLDRGQHKEWFESIEIWLELLIALSAFWMFCVHIATSSNPIFHKELIANRNLVVGSALMIILGMILIATMALLPIMLQSLFGYPVIDTGIIMASRGLGVMTTMGLAGRLAARLDIRAIISVGLLIIAASFYEMSLWNLETSNLYFVVNGFVQGLGMGLLFVPITLMAYSTLPASLRTDGASIMNLTRSIGSSAGISFVITILSRSSSASHEGLAAHITPYSMYFDPSWLIRSDATQAGLTMMNMEVTRQASMIAYINVFHILLLITISFVPMALFIKKSKADIGRAEMSLME
ncbi:MAG: DHA2 family efflux MFS transporter permease subunit [Sphingobium sp.]